MKKAAQIQCWALGGLALALLAMAGWSQSPDKEATIRMTIKVPLNASLYVETQTGWFLTKQKDEIRYFESPPLPTGKKYTYSFKVTWMKDGKEQERKRKVRVEPGKENPLIDMTKEETKKTTDKKVTDKKATDIDKKKVTDKKADKAITDKAKFDKDKIDLGPKDAPVKDAPVKDTKKNGNTKPNPDDKGARAPRTREFLFTYGATVTGLRPGQTARIWVPVPPSNEDQRARMVPREQPFRG
jgi:uncharacterized protein (TIGR03000 family)